MDFNETQDNGQTEQNVTEQQNLSNENTTTQYSEQPYNSNPYATTQTFTAEVEVKGNNGLAIGSLICGIVSILLCCCCGLGILVGATAIVLAILSKKNSDGKFSGMALAGLICGIVGVVFGVGGLFYWLLGGAEALRDSLAIYG